MSHIELVDVSVHFESKGSTSVAVDQVSLNIEKGEIYGIVGLSGAGKSTLVRTINLLQEPSDGQVRIDGEELTSLSKESLRKKRQNIGMIFQHFNLIASKTIAQNLEFALKASRYPKKKRKERVEELLEIVGLSDKANAYPQKLSGGQKQRVGIARALANQPEILLCDEATSALDVETTEEILNILKHINQQYGITILFITHEMDVAKKLFHRMAVMEKGQVVEEGPTFDLFANPQVEMTKKLVSRALSLDIPGKLMENLEEGELVNIHYQGSGAYSPIISTLSKKLDVHFSIIHGKVDYIDGRALGVLLVHITGKAEEIEKSIHLLADDVFQIERVSQDRTVTEVTEYECR
ncbi:Methionine ABC transporter ATP-binding protein [Alkalibacterium sp. AK22]|uniref:methionine ABC transporter ATP-binding protein n=1 Tax=Alkalibacterium sp. AK22 TaxID=1229520 RepID=UPI00044CB650|nr:ATP-binding cassette domain-containing protein [Alkalibacterium sp. AK22]EXJ24078.1 Methionine ABC transporter ATP-binding protein [Alkalibacterium sp. AK22]